MSCSKNQTCCGSSKKQEDCGGCFGDVESEKVCGGQPAGNSGCGASSNNSDRCSSNSNRKPPMDDDDDDKPPIPTCIGWISPQGSEMAVFDAQGNIESFSYRGGGNIRDLCFSSHGHDADDFLTPCFDEEGLHGEPEESCFCGVDTPHLHAHLNDPKTCSEDAQNDQGTTSGNLDSHLMALARITLHPAAHSPSTDIVIPPEDTAQKKKPSRCNSMDYTPVNQAGGPSVQVKVMHDDHQDFLVYNHHTGDLHLEHPCEECGGRDWHGTFDLIQRRTWQVDDNQVQFNIYDPQRKVATFEANKQGECAHKQSETCCDQGSCNNSNEKTDGCGGGSCCRKQDQTETSNCCDNDACCTKDVSADPKDCCFTNTCSQKASKISECCVKNTCSKENASCSRGAPTQYSKDTILKDEETDSLTCCSDESSCTKPCCATGVCTLKRGRPQSTQNVGRSRFYVDKICCASEIPAIRSIVEPLDGVSEVLINVTTKMVYVDHVALLTTAQDICDSLNEQGFGASVEHDHAITAGVASSFVVSILSVDKFSVQKLNSFLSSLPKEHVERFEINEASNQLMIIHNPLFVTASDLATEVTIKTGTSATVKVDGDDGKEWEFTEFEQIAPSTTQRHMLRPSVALSGLFWIISMLSYIGSNWEYLEYAGLVSVAFGLPHIAVKAFRTMTRFQFDANCLMLFATLGAIALKDFVEAAAVAFLFSLSEWLEVRATSRAREALSSIVNLRPEKANLIHPRTKELVVVPVGVVPVGAVVSVKSGEKIPCDGVVVEGSTTVDESSLTGESRPVRTILGDDVQGGTINSGNTQIVVQTIRSSDDSAVSRLIRLVEEAQANRSETEKIVDRFAQMYTPIIVFVALCMCTIPWAWGRDVGRQWTELGLVLVVVACPCALIISTPVSYVAGLAATAQYGILIKGGAHLEALGKVSTIFFDKTGTLTEGQFKLLHLNTDSATYDRVQILQYLSLMEERASHPLAQSLVNGARNEGVKIPETLFVQDHTFLPGEGVSGVINGKQVYVGNARLFSRLGLFQKLSEAHLKLVSDWEAIGGTTGFVSISDEGIVGSYCVADALRPEAKAVLDEFHSMGISVCMLTGDRRDAALSIGHSVGLNDEEIQSELLPEEKLWKITEAQTTLLRGRMAISCLNSQQLVMMVGDGVNDAPSLAAANIGVAMGAGAALAMETADVTLMDSNLEKLSYSIRMGKRVINKIKQNVAFSLIVKFLVLGFALADRASLWAAIASDVGAMLVVTLNGMSLLPTKRHFSARQAGVADKEQIDADQV